MSEWQEIDNALVKEWLFDDFDEAWAAAEEVVPLFEVHEHHPEITVSWGKLTISTTTHDAGSVLTEKDEAITQAIDEVLG